MKKIIVVALTAGFLLGGCAAQPTKSWNKDGGVTPDQYGRDVMYCRQYGMQSATANGLAGNLFVETWITREAGNCMRQLGYY